MQKTEPAGRTVCHQPAVQHEPKERDRGTVAGRGVHGSGKPHSHGIPMGMGIAIQLMMAMGMGMGIKPMGMGIAYIACV